MTWVPTDILLSPAGYGLTNVTDPACPGCGFGFPEPDAIDTLVPNPDEYFYWDPIDPTRVVHAIAGKAAAEEVWMAVLWMNETTSW